VKHWIDSERLNGMPSDYEMQQFMGFYEEIAIMINSRLMSTDLAAYTFGIDAAKFYDVVTKYHNDPNFRLFNSFAPRMKERLRTLSKTEIENLRF
jgi:hypothetical protein